MTNVQKVVCPIVTETDSHEIAVDPVQGGKSVIGDGCDTLYYRHM